MSTMTSYRIGDLGSEARAVVETLVGRGLVDEDRLRLVVNGGAPDPVSEADEAEKGERQREARSRLMEELDALPVRGATEGGTTGTTEVEEGERQRRAWLRLSAELDALPMIHHDDVLSAADVDRVIYGGPA